MKAAIYTQGNTERLQELRDYCLILGWETVEFCDLNAIMNAARAGQINVVVVYRCQDAVENMLQFVNLLGDLQILKVQFVSIFEHVDSTTPQGNLLISILAAYANFERETFKQPISPQVRP